MADLKLEHIYKVYPNGTKAVNDFSLDVKNGEFIVFVGPSGCGKSTTLRMIAGLEDITAGELYIDDQIVNDMQPKDRDVAMVFQNYALYPQMTVYENMAFSLQLRHVPNDIIQEKVLWAADILGIKEYLDRKPRNMSGGQRQRVSLGRAILRDPKVMLLDEPLSNLDAKLRAQMRTEIAKLHKKLKTTFVYVTHDQTEAMTLGDRVVVMKMGRIQQVDTPKNLYNYPDNKFVAGFIGTPEMNFLTCTLLKEGDKVKLHILENDATLTIDYNKLLKVLPKYFDGKHECILGVRCEHVLLAKEGDPNSIKVKTSHFEELGADSLIYATVKDSENVTNSSGEIIIKTTNVNDLKPDQDLYVKFDLDNIHLFDKESEENIVPRIPEYNSFNCDIKDHKLIVEGASLQLPDALSQVSDYSNIELRLPTNNLNLHGNDIPCKVVDIESIGDKKLAHLQLGKRIFFALADDTIKVGDSIKASINFSQITLVDGDNKVWEPISEFDYMHASFVNYETTTKDGQNTQFIKLKEERTNEANLKANKMREEFESKYQEERSQLDSKDIASERERINSEYESLKVDTDSKVKEILDTSKQKQKELTSEFNRLKKEAKEKNDKLFNDKKEKEVREYKEFMSRDLDKESKKRRQDEYHMFMDNFKTDKDNTLNTEINNMTLNYESDLSSIKAQARREADSLKKTLALKKDEVNMIKDPYKDLDKRYKKDKKLLDESIDKEIKRAGFLFFFRFDDGHYQLLPEVITNKLIQGLSTRVFSKDFLVEVPHDAYKESDESFLDAKVDQSHNYGTTYYVNCHYVNQQGKESQICLKKDAAIESNTQLKLTVDLTKCQITETEMGIRLY